MGMEHGVRADLSYEYGIRAKRANSGYYTGKLRKGRHILVCSAQGADEAKII